jgi:hypothetical protein
MMRCRFLLNRHRLQNTELDAAASRVSMHQMYQFPRSAAHESSLAVPTRLVLVAHGHRQSSRERDVPRRRLRRANCCRTPDPVRTSSAGPCPAVQKSHLQQDKGHGAECEAFVRAVKQGTESPIPFDSIVNTTLTAIRLAESVRNRRQVEVSWSIQDASDEPVTGVIAKDAL